MKNLSAKLACGLLAISLFTSSLSGCGKTTGLDGTQKAFEIDGESVNLGTANFLLRFQQGTMMSYYSMFGQSAGTSAIFSSKTKNGTYGEEFKKDVLDSIEKMYLLRAKADDYQVSLSDDDMKKADDAAASFMKANNKDVQKKLGVTKKDVSEALQLYTYQSKVSNKILDGIEVEVSDDEAAQTSITFVKVSADGTKKDKDGKTIALTKKEKEKKKEQAQQILDKINTSGDPVNADMDALAKEVDKDLSAAQNNYGKDDKETTVDEALQKAAEKLQDGQVNPEVIEGKDGAYYVLRLDKTFDQEKTEAKKQLMINDKKQEKYKKLLDDWLKKADTKTTKYWDKLRVTDKDVYTFKQPKQQEQPTAPSTDSSSTNSSSSSTSSKSTSAEQSSDENTSGEKTNE
ncbi:hypothetical protein INP51_15495 [Blautia liquoris]|uniref:PpiC domain-containing protein n=1 Tax=Blautia liquoris TaxID=2779518 RepID=A0A7M2RH03_9FIRM|nr:hypothetical protein [Blautia liquoris]QOV19321.1 hypothetical protein INP51_15495 [Blautia liquoris]